jgi:hypothetical protein
MHRFLTAWLAVVLPLACLAADDTRPACGSQNQGQLWPEAANHDSKLFAHLMRCGELFLCVRGTWHYHWESPSIRVDQLGRHAKSNQTKPSVCEIQAAVAPPVRDAPPANGKPE